MRVRYLLAFWLLLPALPLAARPGDFDVRPAPAWVEPAPADVAMTVPKDQVRYGIYGILHDHQVRVAGGQTTEYYRRVQKVVSPSGVQNASEVSLDFDPSYQRLVIHDISLIRNGRRVDELEPDEIRVIEKEDESRDRIYDGIQTAMAFLRDVRPGDVLDYSWSLVGANPILSGKYADAYELDAAIPTGLIRHRLLWPAGRPLHQASSLKGMQPSVEQQGDEHIYTWTRRDVAALDVEDETPEWFDPWDGIRVTEFGSWAEVAQWSVPMFRLDAASTEAVRDLAAKFRTEQKTRDGQLLAAIRFVQDDIRYLGIEMGRNSHEPHQPSETIEQRWGDCKDKAFLLSALLRELGAEAYPALVNTRARHTLDQRLPSPFSFDHVITELVEGGRTYWVDATISDQGGTLQTIETPDDERALVIRPETATLTPIRVNEKGSTVIEQTYDSADYKGVTQLEVRSTYRGADADRTRSLLASMSVPDLAKERINRYAADQPKIAAVGLPKISDDRAGNTIVIVERYTIRDLWKNGEWSFYPRAIENHIHRPETMIRSMPLAFDYPLNLTQRMTFNLPEHLDIQPVSSVTENGTFRYNYQVDSNGKTVTIVHSLHALKDSVAVAEVPDHLTRINEIWDNIGYGLHPNADDSAAAGIKSSLAGMTGTVRAGWGGAILGGVALIAILVTVPRNRALRRRRQFARNGGFRPGEAPVSAVLIRDASEIPGRLLPLPCPCGSGTLTTPELSRARYEERELTIATRRCASCGREQNVYFREHGLIAV